MSDFLSQFENNSYKKENSKKQEIKKEEVIKAPKYVEQVKNKTDGISSIEHDTEIDHSYHKRKIIRYIVIGTIIAFVCIIIFLIIFFLNRVAVKNFVGLNISEAKTWGLKNNIEIDVESIYSVEQDDKMVISQDKMPPAKMQKGSILYVKVSKGADPEETLELPNFREMNQTQIKEWIDQNKAYNITITQEFSEEVIKGNFIKMEFKDEEVNETNYKRKDSLIVYVSRGSQKDEKNIVVPDFTKKAKTEVETWAKTNSIETVYIESGSEEVLVDMVISQDKAAGTKIAKNDKITVTVSIGKGALVPNFSKYTQEEAMAASTDLAVTVKTKYSPSVSYGKLISQSVKSGVKLYGENKKVEVIYSIGKPYIDNLIGMKEKDLAPYFYDFQSKGANITYSAEYVDSYEEKGTVVWASGSNEYVDMTTHIYVNISKGNLVSQSSGNQGNTQTPDLNSIIP